MRPIPEMQDRLLISCLKPRFKPLIVKVAGLADIQFIVKKFPKIPHLGDFIYFMPCLNSHTTGKALIFEFMNKGNE
jgi:hypothetical protein